MDNNQETRWVDDRLATLEPRWQPNAAEARVRLQAKLTPAEPRRWVWLTAAATASAVAVSLAVPAPRAVAQRFWERLVLQRVEVMRIDASTIPLKSNVSINGGEQRVGTIEEAERKAGFRPSLPSAGLFSTNPEFMVTGSMRVEQKIRIADIAAALRKSGAGDVELPKDWDGVVLHANLGHLVGIGYGDVQILQSRPVELFVPAGFALDRFAETIFRSIGMSADDARTMGRKFAANPSWLLSIPADEEVKVQEITVRGLPALLVEDLGEKNSLERATVIWNTRERVYTVASPSAELSRRVAESLP